jgi:hypothetical protein
MLAFSSHLNPSAPTSTVERNCMLDFYIVFALILAVSGRCFLSKIPRCSKVFLMLVFVNDPYTAWILLGDIEFLVFTP